MPTATSSPSKPPPLPFGPGPPPREVPDAADRWAPLVAVWVLIMAFVGMAVDWIGGDTPIWAGALIGGGTVFSLGVLAIATARGGRDNWLSRRRSRKRSSGLR